MLCVGGDGYEFVSAGQRLEEGATSPGALVTAEAGRGSHISWSSGHRQLGACPGNWTWDSYKNGMCSNCRVSFQVLECLFVCLRQGFM